MKVPCQGPGVGARRSRRSSRWLLAVGLCLGSVGTWAARNVGVWLDDWAVRNGHHVLDQTSSFWRGLLAVPGRVLRSPAIPHLQLDVKLEHMRTLRQKREEALAKGLLETEAGDMVPGVLTADGRSLDVALRLKGDWVDHLQGTKWSFRIEVDGDDHAFGMRRFSIQDPRTRGFQGEPLFFAVLRDIGVVAPRYSFVTVTLNGTDLGMMAFEEHVGRELLEHSDRRDSVVVKFDETLVFHGLYDYRTAPIVAFQPRRIAKIPQLAAECDTAIALLRAFVLGELPASRVFAVDELAAWLAAAELFGVHHCLRWHNLRWYFDPIACRLGPIAFDANLHERARVQTVVTAAEPIVAHMLEDPVVERAFVARLGALCAQVADGSFAQRYAAADRRWAEQLQSEFVMLAPFDWSELANRARFHAGIGEIALRDPGLLDDYVLPVRACLVQDAGGMRLELINAVPHRVHVSQLRWVAGDRSEPFVSVAPLALPLELAPAPRAGRPVVVAIPCRPPAGPFDTVELVAGLVGRKLRQQVLSVAQPSPLHAQPVPTGTVDEQLARHPFLSLDGEHSLLRAAPGDWRVQGLLIVPPGFGLTIPAGTRLRFGADGALVAHGPVQVDGRPDAPVAFEGVDGGHWLGIAVLDPGQPVVWQNAIVRDTAGMALPRWQLTGGVTFVRADVTLRGVQFAGTIAEDALNVVRGSFALDDCRFAGTRSDAFDADFADGSVRGGEFRDIGGDAVDVSGSAAEASGVRFVDVHDKAVSVGERSTLRARDLRIERAGTGAACKDDSTLELSDSTIADYAFCGLAAYVKKPEFGAARIRAERVTFTGDLPRTVVQRGSRIALDGVEQPAQDVDVDRLYQTVMKKDGTR